MEKISLTKQNINGLEVLSRNQLKNVMGGLAPANPVNCRDDVGNTYSCKETDLTACTEACISELGDACTVCSQVIN